MEDLTRRRRLLPLRWATARTPRHQPQGGAPSDPRIDRDPAIPKERIPATLLEYTGGL